MLGWQVSNRAPQVHGAIPDGCRPAHFRRRLRGPLIGAAYLGRFFRLDVTGEVVEDRLPTTALLLDVVGGFAVEGDADCNAVGTGRELDLARAVAERVLDQLVRNDLGIGASEIKTHAAVFCLHTRGEFAALS